MFYYSQMNFLNFSQGWWTEFFKYFPSSFRREKRIPKFQNQISSVVLDLKQQKPIKVRALRM